MDESQFINPMFVNQQQRPMQMEQYPQFAHPNMIYQPPRIQHGLNGRIIDDLSTVNPSEVSMTGTISIFPKRDMKEIYVKQYQNDGSISTWKYVPLIQHDEKLNEKCSDNGTVVDTLMQRLDEIEKKIDGITVKPTSSRAKKESE